MRLTIKKDMTPRGDQHRAISALVRGLDEGTRHQVLLGITGSGKTFTMAKVIEEVQRPTLVLAHNKTLAAQLYAEFKDLFPDNAVHYFVSYYDYYQPEAYLPVTDTYIEKDSQINEEIDRLRHAATNALLTRRDVIVVSSVSCIYGIGSPDFYKSMAIEVYVGQEIDRDEFLHRLVLAQYERGDLDFYRATFRVRGYRVDVFPAESDEWAIRITWFGDEIEKIEQFDPFRGKKGASLERYYIFPSSHYVMPQDAIEMAVRKINDELRERLAYFESQGRLLERQRLEERTLNDVEQLLTTGYCKGIENYSRFFDGRKPGDPPNTLLDYFPDDYLMFIDESHQTIPQVRAMYRGDRSRKESLVEYGFRLPAAYDNRPLKFEEFEERINQVIYVSATPGTYELNQTGGTVVEQIIRPTGLLDPEIEVRPTENQLDDLLEEIRKETATGGRVLVLTLTKRFSEQLTEYFSEFGVRLKYLHSDVETIDRIEILRGLRAGDFDVLVGINLLREGIDLPEVSLVAILDADKEGFLRSATALFQICGRAARNEKGRVIMYADRITPAMEEVITETARRRSIQMAYNEEHGITPKTIVKDIADIDRLLGRPPRSEEADTGDKPDEVSPKELEQTLERLRKRMKNHAKKLEFEEAARLRDRIRELERKYLLGL